MLRLAMTAWRLFCEHDCADRRNHLGARQLVPGDPKLFQPWSVDESDRKDGADLGRDHPGRVVGNQPSRWIGLHFDLT